MVALGGNGAELPVTADGTIATPLPGKLVYGSTLTMVAICFANGLQGGRTASFSQATESLKHSFHIPDVALGALAFTMSTCGAFGAVAIGAVAARMSRVRLLSIMFGLWTVFMTLAALSPSFSVLGFTLSGFVFLFIVMIPTSVTEATDPLALPLISDYWPLNQRAAKISVFNAGAGVGGFLGIALGGVLVDQFGWRGAYAMWIPFGIVGMLLIASRPEPPRGQQDAAFLHELAETAEGAEALADEAAKDEAATAEAGKDAAPIGGALPQQPSKVDRKALVKEILQLRTWRTVTIAIGVSQIMLSALQLWGPAYFKRTFHLSGTEVGALTPLLGAGSFLGIIAGGFVADRLLRRGVLRARIWVSAAGYGGAGIAFLLAFSTRSLAVAAPMLALAATLLTLPTGPSYALMMDATPTRLREEASGVADVIMYINAIGAPIVGGISTLLGDNLRVAMLCISPACLVGAGLFLMARHTYLNDLAGVVSGAASAS
jgi:predicted MFS family arabinose efflux permease